MLKQVSRLFIWTIFILFVSCSLDRRISKAVKRLGAKDVATHIAIEYPEYLRADSVPYAVNVEVPVEVKVPEIEYDTLYLPSDTINECKSFNYTDKFLSFNVSEKKGKVKVNYTIKERELNSTENVKVEGKVPCPPCPTVDVVQNAKQYYEAKELKLLSQKAFYKKGFFSLLLLLLCLIAFQFFKGYLKTIFPFIK